MFSRLLQQRARQFVAAILRPLARLGINPNVITLLGLLLSMLTALVIAFGWITAGGALVLFAGIFDMFDGAMARVCNAATTFGAFLDSTLDRYSESIILLGLLFYVLPRPGLHEAVWPWPNEQQWMIVLIFVAAVGSLMVSYAKARAEGLGLECKTGLLARPERVVILAIGLLTGTTIWALVLLALLSHVTAIERIMHVWLEANWPTEQNRTAPISANGLTQGAETRLSPHGLAHDEQKIVPNRLAPIDEGEQKHSPTNSVPTNVPPLTGSVQHD